jgi:hypothetical protein
MLRLLPHFHFRKKAARIAVRRQLKKNFAQAGWQSVAKRLGAGFQLS